MELISKEEAISKIEQYSERSCSIYVKTALKLIDETPTIESRPNGKWIETKTLTGTAYSCSICGTLKVHKHNYCEQCGADMRTRAESEESE